MKQIMDKNVKKHFSSDVSYTNHFKVDFSVTKLDQVLHCTCIQLN